MNEKSRLRLLLFGSIGTAVLSAAIRILLTLTCFDAYYGVYAHDSALPTVYHILLLLLLGGLCACGILFPAKREAEEWEEGIIVHGTGLTGGTVDSCRDHRIAMAAAVASTVCTEPVTILGAECVKKSYPKFWEEFHRLGGKYELNLR